LAPALCVYPAVAAELDGALQRRVAANWEAAGQHVASPIGDGVEALARSRRVIDHAAASHRALDGSELTVLQRLLAQHDAVFCAIEGLGDGAAAAIIQRARRLSKLRREINKSDLCGGLRA